MLPLNSIIVRITLEVSVATLPTAATVEFLISAMRVLPRGATAPRNACGKITRRAAVRNGSPMARAASA